MTLIHVYIPMCVYSYPFNTRVQADKSCSFILFHEYIIHIQSNEVVFLWNRTLEKLCLIWVYQAQFFSSPSDLMKSTVVDESLSTNATRVLFQRKTTSLLQETTECETYTIHIQYSNKCDMLPVTANM